MIGLLLALMPERRMAADVLPETRADQPVLLVGEPKTGTVELSRVMVAENLLDDSFFNPVDPGPLVELPTLAGPSKLRNRAQRRKQQRKGR